MKHEPCIFRYIQMTRRVKTTFRLGVKILAICLVTIHIQAQRYYSDDMPLVSFGVQAGGLFTTNLLNIRTNFTDLDGKTLGIDPLNGYSLGGILSLRLNQTFFIQTGINMTRRNQLAYVRDGSVFESVRMRFLIYEIPVFAAYYLRLSDASFLNLSTGLPIQFAPSALFSTSGNIAAESLKTGVARPVSTTLVGFEHRTLTKGGFYIGLSYTIAPWHLFLTKVTYRVEPQNKEYVFRHIGDHAGVVLRYYFK